MRTDRRLVRGLLCSTKELYVLRDVLATISRLEASAQNPNEVVAQIYQEPLTEYDRAVLRAAMAVQNALRAP